MLSDGNYVGQRLRVLPIQAGSLLLQYRELAADTLRHKLDL